MATFTAHQMDQRCGFSIKAANYTKDPRGAVIVQAFIL